MSRFCPARIRPALAALIILASTATGPAAAAGPVSAAPAAVEVVDALHLALADAMSRSGKLGCEGRLKLLLPVVDDSFDIAFVAERALRRHWKTLDEPQRQAFIAAMRRSFSTTYATEFAEPDAVQFTTGRSETLANGDALVHTALTPRGGRAITLDYVLKPRGSDWQVVNVLADGVSDLALRASQYDGLIKSQGFDALMTRLEQQTLALKARCP